MLHLDIRSEELVHLFSAQPFHFDPLRLNTQVSHVDYRQTGPILVASTLIMSNT